MKRVLFIGGTDPSGGAGLQADLRTAQAFNVWGLSVVTSVVAQNTNRVLCSTPLSGDLLARQLDSIQEDIAFDAIKIGMIGSLANLKTIKLFVQENRNLPVVLDPIYFDGSGETRLADDSLFQEILDVLGSDVSIITPNAKEAFAWEKGSVDVVLKKLHHYGADILLKSGHLESKNEDYIFDYWYDKNGLKKLKSFPRKDIDPRGTGCHLASAIAIGLALEKTHVEAVEDARAWLATKFQTSLVAIGKGRRLIQ